MVHLFDLQTLEEEKGELLETGVQLGAWEARLLFAAQGEADCDLWRFANGEGRLGADLPRI